MHALKGPDHVIETARLMREHAPELSRRLEFVIAGDGPEHDRLRERAASLGLENIQLVGFQEDVRAFLASLDIDTISLTADSLPGVARRLAKDASA